MKRIFCSGIGATVIAVSGILFFGSGAPIQAQDAGQTIIDTFPYNNTFNPSCDAPAEDEWSITNNWVATAQTLTTPANNVLTDYRFRLAAPPDGGGRVRFSVYQWAAGPTGPVLYTTLIPWPGVDVDLGYGTVNLTGINLTLATGTQYGMTIELYDSDGGRYGGLSVHYNCNRAGYSSGTDSGWWLQNSEGVWQNFSGFNHKFRLVLVDGDSDDDGVPDDSDNCPTSANPDQADADDDGVGDACDNCFLSNPGQEDSDEDGVGNACELPGGGGEGGEDTEQTFDSNNREREYRATVPGQTEPETFNLAFEQVLNPLVCTVNFRLVLIAEEAPRLAKLNAARAAQGKPPLQQLEYTDHDHNERGYGIRYEVDCFVDEPGGRRRAIPGQDYNRPNIAFTFHADEIEQFDIAQERTLEQSSGTWVPEADSPLDLYDRLLSELGPVHLAKSSCDCVGSAGTLDLSWFIAVSVPLEDPDGPLGPALPGEAELVTVSPQVRNNGTTFWNPFRLDGSFRPGLPIAFTVRLRNTATGAWIRDPNIRPPSESGLVATIKRVVEGDVDDNVPLEGFLRFWGDDGAFTIDLLRQGYYTYVWQTVRQDTLQPLPAGKYTVTIASKYTTAKPFVINLR